MIKKRLFERLTYILQKLHIDSDQITLDHPTRLEFGDYTTNIALQLSKKTGQEPRELAQKIADGLTGDETVEKTQVAGPGFINIWLKKDHLLNLLTVGTKSQYGKNKTVLLEYGQPNTHKLPHIGHLFSYIYGESLARVFEFLGETVYRVNYQGDIGLHVAKCLSMVDREQWDKVKQESLEKQVAYLQKCYQEGSAAYENDAAKKEKIQKINADLYRENSDVKPLWQETREANIEYLARLEKKLGIAYDRSYFETETAPVGKKLVEENIGKVFEKSEGAVIFKGETYGLHTRVFINSQGLPTYEAKDIGLYALKKKDFTFDSSIITTANEQSGYAKVVAKAAELIFPELEGKLHHIGFGMVNLTTGKMASRTGQIIDAVTLIDTVKDRIKTEFKIENDLLVEKIAFAAIKYSFLRSDAFTNIAFDIEKSISREGDSGPYLLYTFVRCQSVLNKAGEVKGDISSKAKLEPEDMQLVRLLYRLPEAVEKAATNYSPHFIADYLFELAQKYNLSYQKLPILKAEEDIKKLRLLITKKTASVIGEGLKLLGIETVEIM